MDSGDTASKPEPSQVSGGVTQLQGTIESTIGNITGAESWKATGETHQKVGAQEIEEAQQRARKEAQKEKVHGKIDSAKGMLFGDADKQTHGNVQVEKAEWRKAIEGDHQLPEVSAERMDAKIKTAVGIITGDKEKQNKGNRDAEKAEWLHG